MLFFCFVLTNKTVFPVLLSNLCFRCCSRTFVSVFFLEPVFPVLCSNLCFRFCSRTFVSGFVLEPLFSVLFSNLCFRFFSRPPHPPTHPPHFISHNKYIKCIFKNIPSVIISVYGTRARWWTRARGGPGPGGTRARGGPGPGCLLIPCKLHRMIKGFNHISRNHAQHVFRLQCALLHKKPPQETQTLEMLQNQFCS